MAMRNFWITGKADGKATPIGFGPRAKDGGFELEVMVRDNGESVRAVRITGFARSDGSLSLRVTHYGDLWFSEQDRPRYGPSENSEILEVSR